MSRTILSLLVVFLCMSVSPLLGQSYVLKYKSNQIDELPTYRTSFFSLDSVYYQVEEDLRILHERGFLGASVDTVIVSDTVVQADVYVGDKMASCLLSYDEKDRTLLERIFRKHLPKEVDFQLLEATKSEIVTYLTNHGHPFAKVETKLRSLAGNVPRLQLSINKGEYFTFGGVKVDTSQISIDETFLAAFLDVEEGTPFDLSKVKDVNRTLERLTFLKAKGNPGLSFVEKEVYVVVNAERVRSNRFDILIGAQPANATIEERLFITGKGLLNIKNVLGKGEELYVDFERLRPESQELDLAVNLPYFKGIPFGALGRFGLLKQDSSFININSRVGVIYQLSKGDFLNFYWDRESTNLIQADTLTISQTGLLPDRLDTRYNGLGTTYQINRTNNLYTPTDGFAIQIEASGGVKKIQKNGQIIDLSTDQFDLEAQYDSIGLSNLQSRVTFRGDYFIPVGKRNTVLISNQSGWLQSENDLYVNELFRIGGARTLRGFDDESLFVSLYSVMTLEYRLIFAPQSYISAFIDGGYLEEDSSNRRFSDLPVGFGAGFAFKTGIGVFKLDYALGNSKELPFDLSAGNIHFGYVSFF